MSLIQVFLSDFRGIVRNPKFVDSPNANVHPVSYFDFSLLDPNSTIIAFYKPVGSFIYCVKIDKKTLAPDNPKAEVKTVERAVQAFKVEFSAIELKFPVYHYHIELSGRQFQ